MGKRYRTNSEDYKYISRKIRKLENRLLRARRKHRQRSEESSSSSRSCWSYSSSRSSSRSRSASPRPRAPPLVQPTIDDVSHDEHGEGAVVPAPILASTDAAAPTHVPRNTAASLPPSIAAPTQPPSSNNAVLQPATDQVVINLTPPLALSAPTVDTPDAKELDEDLLKILGEDPSQVRVYGNEINSDLAIRLQFIATNGLSKETRKQLLDKYLPPSNGILIDAPVLNPEVKAAVHDHIFKRDKSIEIRQKQLASAISGIAESLTLLLSEHPRNNQLIQLLMDSCRILCDGQNAESLMRRNFILHNLKKELKDELQTTKIDKFLFSQELPDKLKAAKAISKSGDDLKAVPSTLGLQSKKSTKLPPRNLNWRGPPQNHYKQRRTQKTKEPSRKSRRDNSSRTSSRPHQGRSNRR